MKFSLSRSPLSGKVIVLLLGAGLLPVAVLSSLTFWITERTILSHLGREMAIHAEEVGSEITREMLRLPVQIETLIRQKGTDVDAGYLLTALMSQPHPEYDFYLRPKGRCISIFDAEGAILSEAGLCMNRQDTLRRLERATQLGSSMSEVYFSPDSVPLVDILLVENQASEGNSQRSYLFTLSLEYLSDILGHRYVDGGFRSEIILYDELDSRPIAGRFVENKVPGVLTHTLPLLAGKPTHGFEVLKQADNTEELLAVTDPSSLAETYPQFKNWRLALIQPLDDLSEETIATLADLRRIVGIALLIAIGACLASSFILLQIVLPPIRRFSRAAERVTAGDLDTQITVSSDDEFGQLAKTFNRMVSNLRWSKEELQRLATTDQLTNLPNRWAFQERLTAEIRRASRYKRSFSLAILDIDHFKSVNDCFGHAAGDFVLQKMAETIVGFTRQVDFVSRYGGEEIVFLLPETSKKKSLEMMERLRMFLAFRNFHPEPDKQRLNLTVSIGVSTFPEDGDEGERLFQRADAALYEAKTLGRNRVVTHRPGMLRDESEDEGEATL